MQQWNGANQNLLLGLFQQKALIINIILHLRVSAYACVPVKLKLQHPPPPGIPQAFDAFSCPGGREFDHHP